METHFYDALENQSFSSSSPFASASSSSAARKVRKTNAGDGSKENAAEDQEPPQKKRNNDDSSNPTNCDEIQIVDRETMLNNLPQNVLKKILGNLDTPTLFAVRLASRKFSEISSSTLRSRPKANIDFFAFDNEFSKFIKGNRRNLKDFLSCFQQPVSRKITEFQRNCPYSHFSFFFVDNPVQRNDFDNRDWLSFLSQFADNESGGKMTLKCLKLFIRHVGIRNNRILLILAGKLRDLLSNQIKALELEEFGLDIPPLDGVDTSQIHLFPNSSSIQIQLPHLKVLHFQNSMLKKYPGIVEDLLRAAVNLTRIKILPEFQDGEMCNFTASTYQLLQSTGKIHCLEEAEIYLADEFLKVIKDQIKLENGAGVAQVELQNFKLKRLKLSLDSDLNLDLVLCFSTRELEKGVITSFISNVLSSSKNSMTSLSLTPLGFFRNLQLPTFTILKELGLAKAISGHPLSCDGSFQFFPRGVRSRNIFPAVQFLDLTHIGNGDWCNFFPQQDSIPRLPKVKTLSVVDRKLGENAIANISLMCINLKELKISRKDREPPKINFLQVARAIWTDIKQLESLEIDVDVDSVDSGENSTSNFDSCFTGFSPENCQRLHEVMNATKTFKKWRVLMSKSESELRFERDFVSILEMKDLKKLIINPYSGEKLLDRKYFFKEKLTWISAEYAFKLMPQLQMEK